MAKKDITVIVPIHSLEGGLKELYPKALETVPQGVDLIVATSGELMDELKLLSNREARFVFNEDTSFASLVNAAVKEVKTEYFSILEADDEYSDNWLANAETYIKYKDDVSAFLFLTDMSYLPDKEGKRKFIMFSNEAPLATGFSKETGLVDFDCLEHFVNHNVTGAVINKKDWEETGGLKTNFKLTFWYEWLYRFIYNQKKVVVIPKLGYVHTIDRPGALFKSYEGVMTDQETEYWFKLIKREYYYKEQRELPTPEELAKEEEENQSEEDHKA